MAKRNWKVDFPLYMRNMGEKNLMIIWLLQVQASQRRRLHNPCALFLGLQRKGKTLGVEKRVGNVTNSSAI